MRGGGGGGGLLIFWKSPKKKKQQFRIVCVGEGRGSKTVFFSVGAKLSGISGFASFFWQVFLEVFALLVRPTEYPLFSLNSVMTTNSPSSSKSPSPRKRLLSISLSPSKKIRSPRPCEIVEPGGYVLVSEISTRGMIDAIDAATREQMLGEPHSGEKDFKFSEDDLRLCYTIQALVNNFLLFSDGSLQLCSVLF